jgi:hypothetical protein
MVEHSPEEIRATNIERMGEALGNQFSALWQELAQVHVEWQEYVILFGTKPERIDILNNAAPSFFHMIQERFWDVILLNISRFTDPPKSAGRCNLTITSLPSLIFDTELKAKVHDLVMIAKEKASFCREWRNRRIAHNDLALALNESAEPLAEASRLLVSEALSALTNVMGEIESYYHSGYRTDYGDIITMNGAEDLLYVLNDGLAAKSERRKRINDGNYTLGSGLIDHSQKMTIAAIQIADMKVWAHRS